MLHSPVQPHSRKQRSSRPGPSELDEWASVEKFCQGPFCQIVWTNWLPEMEKIMAMVRTATEPTKIGSNLLEQELQDSCQDWLISGMVDQWLCLLTGRWEVNVPATEVWSFRNFLSRNQTVGAQPAPRHFKGGQIWHDIDWVPASLK